MSETVNTPNSSSGGHGKRLCALLVEFPNPEALKAAARKMRKSRYTRWDSYSPFPIHGLMGCLIGLGLQWFCNTYDYPFLVSGKPYFSLPAFIPVTFELTILFAATGAFVGMILLNGLPMLYNGLFNSERFTSRATTDGYFIAVQASDVEFDVDEATAFLETLGGGEVEKVWEDRQPVPRGLIRYGLTGFGIILALSLIPPLLITRARATTQETTRFQFIPDMDQQSSFKAQEANPLFADLRAMRPVIPGTVSRGHSMVDDHLYRGIQDATWAVAFPIRLDATVMRRGHDRYNIFCAPCHGLDGYGKGMVAVRGDYLSMQAQATWVQPTSYHDPMVRDRPVGHIFNTITNGIRTMPPYGDQIPVEDRWAIVAYVRALQRSQNATLGDVPVQYRTDLGRPQP